MSQIDLQWFASAEDEGRTEEPSQIKLDRARKEGRVAKSQELNSAIALLLSTITLIILGKWIYEQCIEIYIFFFTRAGTEDFFNPANGVVFLTYFLKIVLPIALVGVVGAIAGNLIQNRGFIFSFKPITPKFSNIVPHIGQYLKKTMFSKTGLFNGTIMVFISSIGMFIVPDVMGGAKTVLIGNLIQNQFLSARDWPFGSALSIILAVMSLVLIMFYYKALSVQKGGVKNG